MISSVELHRILAEWRVRLQRAKEILQPPVWKEKDWRQFSQALALMVRDHGRSWIIDPNVYWDLRWNLQDGGELVCQIEHIPGEKTSLVVAQNGGFAQSVGSYTWLWAEFDMEGEFSRDPYWVEGTWKDALTAFLLPLDRQSNYLLAGRAETPDSLLLQEGARPNDRNSLPLLPASEGSEYNRVPDSAVRANGAEARTVETSIEAKDAKEAISDEVLGAASLDADEKFENTLETNTKPLPSVELYSETLNKGVSATEVPASEVAPVEAASGENTPLHSPSPEIKPDEASGPRVDTSVPFAIRWGMALKLTWKDTDEIAYALIEAHPDQDPLKLSFPKLHKFVIALEEFGDDPDKSSESILESIQMAWYEEVK